MDIEELKTNIGKTVSFEYYSQISGWTYDEDVITDRLISASINFRNIKLI